MGSFGVSWIGISFGWGLGSRVGGVQGLGLVTGFKVRGWLNVTGSGWNGFHGSGVGWSLMGLESVDVSRVWGRAAWLGLDGSSAWVYGCMVLLNGSVVA